MPKVQIPDPLLLRRRWRWRVYRSVGMAVGIVAAALTVGVCGYHYLGNLSWIDALLEASMILGGMGAIAPMTNNVVKLFASAYALCSGLLIISVTGILLAPWAHRLLHRFHAEQEERKKNIGS